jgi:hypothetical protein
LEQSWQQPYPMLSLSRNSIYLVFAGRGSRIFDKCALQPVMKVERDTSPYDWENYNFNNFFPPSSLLHGLCWAVIGCTQVILDELHCLHPFLCLMNAVI